MIDLRFNQPDRALAGIDSLLMNCQSDLGFSNISSLVVFKSKVLGEQGRYAESADNLINFLNQINTATKEKDFATHIALAKFYNEVRNEPKAQYYSAEYQHGGASEHQEGRPRGADVCAC